MAKKQKRFTFKKGEDLKGGSEGQDVAALKAMLTLFGHLRGSYTPGKMCRCTERSVPRYQRIHGLVADGIVGLDQVAAGATGLRGPGLPAPGDRRPPLRSC